MATPQARSEPADKLSTRSKAVLLFTITAVLMVGLLLAAEALIRVRQYIRYGTTATADQLYRLDQASGLRVPIAGLHVGRISTDSRGFRNPELESPKPPGRVRIAFLGASTTWCAEVQGNEHTWPHLVSDALASVVAPAKIDYINAGVPGFGVKRSQVNLKHRVAALQPDVIVIYHATNDLSHEVRVMAVKQGIKSASVGLESSASWLSNHSVLVNLIEKNLVVMRAQRQNTEGSEILKFEPAALGEEFRSELTELIRDAQSVAGLVVVPTFSTRMRAGQSAEEQRAAMASALLYAPFMTHDGFVRGFARYNEIIRAVAKETGSLLVEGEHDIPGAASHFVDSVHFTDAGSAAMADRVIKALKTSPRFAEIAAERAATR